VPTTRRAVVALLRGSTVAIGVVLTTFSFVHLVDVHDQIGLAAPWWWIGLIGTALTLVGLGPPRSARHRRDAGC
jgi:hypothetical protein